MESQFETPMMRQYLEIKGQFKDCILFFRMGDFYEMFLDDAKVGAEVLDITLTSRSKGKDGKIPLAGVPFHAADSYISKMVKAGYKVAIAEQVSDPKAPGLVQRKVVRVVTPGTVLDSESLTRKEANHLVAIRIEGPRVGLAIMEVSTGEFEAAEFDGGIHFGRLLDELARIRPSECILSPDDYDNQDLLGYLSLQEGMNVFPFNGFEMALPDILKALRSSGKVPNLEVLGFDEKKDSLTFKAAGALGAYMRYTFQEQAEHIRPLRKYQYAQQMLLDRSTILNLELFATLRDGEKKGSLVHLLDATITAMGARMLRNWIRAPLLDMGLIFARHEAVELLVNQVEMREFLREQFREIQDLERLVARISMGLGNARDLVSVARSVEAGLRVRKKIFDEYNDLITARKAFFVSSIEMIDEGLSTLADLILNKIVEEPPLDVRGGGMVREGVDEELDRIRKIGGGGREWIRKIEAQERNKTGISSLKVRYNRVFGFYIEISKSNLHLVPEDYVRRQTVVNAERFITEELKRFEDQVLTAEEKINEIEFAIFTEIVKEIMEYVVQLQKLASVIGEIDCLAALAEVAQRWDYVRPEMTEEARVEVVQGRHPVVEQLVGRSAYVPNDLHLNGVSGPTLLMVTGPNMAGKSVFIRQAAMLCLMAQIGSFVPATSACLPIMDSIFVRSGASDAMSRGYSTFMIEMMETAHILHNATDRSLVIMDEIGRGTSTYDGISIAWAVAEALIQKSKGKDLIAGHSHENGNLGRNGKPVRMEEASGNSDGIPGQAGKDLLLKDDGKEVALGNSDQHTPGPSREGNKPGGPWVLFATHYHELQQLAGKYERIANVQVAVEEQHGEPVFLHSVVPGGASASFGVEVAKLAGVPSDVVGRAREVLRSLESAGRNSKSEFLNTKQISNIKPNTKSGLQLGLLGNEEHVVVKELQKVDVNTMTPMEALVELERLKGLAEKI